MTSKIWKLLTFFKCQVLCSHKKFRKTPLTFIFLFQFYWPTSDLHSFYIFLMYLFKITYCLTFFSQKYQVVKIANFKKCGFSCSDDRRNIPNTILCKMWQCVWSKQEVSLWGQIINHWIGNESFVQKSLKKIEGKFAYII